MNYLLCCCCGQQKSRNLLVKDRDGLCNGAVIMRGGRALCAECVRLANGLFAQGVMSSIVPMPPKDPAAS